METPNDDVVWEYNCLTGTVHHGRPEAIWNLPLVQASLHMFRRDGEPIWPLQELVVARIHQDAMLFVEHGDQPQWTQEWADAIKAKAEIRFDDQLKVKLGEITNHYKSIPGRNDLKGAVERLKAGRLNPGYEPLHPHDSLNLFCRILGQGSMFKVEQEMGL